MADINTVSGAEATQWNTEFIEDYAINKRVIPELFMQQGWMPGNGTVKFTIVQNDAQATQRDRSGNIIYGTANEAQITVDLVEAIGAEKIDNFSEFKSSLDRRAVMNMRVTGAIDRDMNTRALAELDGTTNVYNSGTATTATKAHLKAVIQKFWEATKMPMQSEAFWLISPAMHLQITEITQASSKDFVTDVKLENGMEGFKWLGVTFVPFAGLPGAATSDCKTFLFHRKAMAWKSAGQMQLRVFFENKDLSWYCNAQEWCAPKRLLDAGVWEYHHNDTAAYS